MWAQPMTESEIQCLKENIDKTVEIETNDGERLVARVVSVFDDAEYDEHELFYKLVATNMPESYKHVGDTGGYAVDFEKILSVRPHSEFDETAGGNS
jgi:hypothetical protein